MTPDSSDLYRDQLAGEELENAMAPGVTIAEDLSDRFRIPVECTGWDPVTKRWEFFVTTERYVGPPLIETYTAATIDELEAILEPKGE